MVEAGNLSVRQTSVCLLIVGVRRLAPLHLDNFEYNNYLVVTHFNKVTAMGTTYTEVTIKSFENGHKPYTAQFLVDTGALDCVVPASKLEETGIQRIGQQLYELADGRQVVFDYGLVRIEVMGNITAGRVVFGPENAEPILGVVAIESAVLKVNPVTQELEKMPVSLLK